MGFFGGGDAGGSSREATQLMDRQRVQNEQELEAKRQNLYQTKLDIVKSMGGERWTPEKPGLGGKR